MVIESASRAQWSLSSTVSTIFQATIVTAAVATMTVLSYVPSINKECAAPAATVSVNCATPDVTLARFPQVAQVAIDRQALIWAKFQALVRKWHEERGATSSITAMSMSPAYQSIIGIGEEAVPLIVAQLESEGDDPDHWFWALKAITGANPIKPENRGDSIKMAQSWIDWAKGHGFSV